MGPTDSGPDLRARILEAVDTYSPKFGSSARRQFRSLVENPEVDVGQGEVEILVSGGHSEEVDNFGCIGGELSIFTVPYSQLPEVIARRDLIYFRQIQPVQPVNNDGA